MTGRDAAGAAVAGRPFLTAHWRQLLMVNFAIDPALLAPLVPAGTMLDQHDGAAYVSVVAFRFLHTRVLGMPVPFHRHFEELNLRFYVRRQVGRDVRRAVVFIREVVPRRAIAFVARALYNEPYIALPMRHQVTGDPPRVRYEWRMQGRWQELAASATAPGAVPDEASHASFITEHYWGYTRQRDGRTLEYRVDHPRWTVWHATLTGWPDFAPLYGTAFAGAMTRPASVLIADGSPVTVFRGDVLEADPAPA